MSNFTLLNSAQVKELDLHNVTVMSAHNEHHSSQQPCITNSLHKLTYLLWEQNICWLYPAMTHHGEEVSAGTKGNGHQ